MASMEDFKKLQIKIAEVHSVAPHPNADRLYVLGIKMGEAERQIVAAIRNFYEAAGSQGGRPFDPRCS